MKKLIIIFAVLGVLAAGVGYWFVTTQLPGLAPVISPPPGNIADQIPPATPAVPDSTTTPVTTPITLPAGFSISIYAKDVPGARVLALGPNAELWVSETSGGKIVELKNDSGTITPTVRYSGLRKPHGIVFDPSSPNELYYAEEDKISRIDVSDPDATAEKLVDLPTNGEHFTRTLGFGPDDRLYVSIGSSCNVCHESNPLRASIYTLNRDGSDFKPYATGLRNTVFFTWSDVDGRMWGNDMGRDYLGNDLPPDEINILEQDKNYGWPNCYGQNIHDDNFDHNVYIRNPCMEPFETPAQVDLPAHVAPLGLGFIPEEGWPEDMWYNLIVAEHGSWNSTVPVGYKLVRIKLDAQGNYVGTEDFATGWLTGGGALGRPVDVLIFDGGTMFVTDDKAGVIYKISYDQAP